MDRYIQITRIIYISQYLAKIRHALEKLIYLHKEQT